MTGRRRKLSQEEISRFWEQERSPGEEVSRLRLRQMFGHWKVRFNREDWSRQWEWSVSGGEKRLALSSVIAPASLKIDEPDFE